MTFNRLFHSELGKCKTLVYVVVTDGSKYEKIQQINDNVCLV